MKMNLKYLFIAAVFLAVLSCSNPDRNIGRMIDEAFVNAVEQYLPLADSMCVNCPGRLPHSIRQDGTLRHVPPSSWLSGFFPGSLWYIYEYTGDERIRKHAEAFTSYLEKQQFNTGTHDIGFMMYCSYGNGLRLTSDEDMVQVLINSAESLASRYSPVTGCIRSWDKEVKPGWKYPVIIDNMMNLELLLWAWKQTGDRKYLDVARSHADTTMKNHFRDDNSSYHVVNYDPQTGNVLFQGTFQGMADYSSWSRGQCWGLYGYTVMYRYTGEPEYLKHAQAIASYIMNHPDMPEDKVPYWDYCATECFDTPARDASAAALSASALLELSLYVLDEEATAYREYAVSQLKTLSSGEYTAAVGTNCRMLLKHSTTSFPSGTEVDKPLSYADYYYLEALLRCRKIMIDKEYGI